MERMPLMLSEREMLPSGLYHLGIRSISIKAVIRLEKKSEKRHEKPYGGHRSL